MTTTITWCLLTNGQERRGVTCARQPQQLRADRRLRLELAALPRRPPELMHPRLQWHEAGHPRRRLRQTQTRTRRRARISEQERRDRIATGMTATMVLSAANSGGVERSSPSSAWHGGSEHRRPCFACQSRASACSLFVPLVDCKGFIGRVYEDYLLVWR